MNALHTIPVLLVASLTGCGDKSDDTSGDADQVSIDCTTIYRLQRTWGEATAATVCGPANSMVVTPEGAISAVEITGPDDAAELTDCDVQEYSGSIDASDAAALILNICEEFNECVHVEPVMAAEGGFDVTGLYGEIDTDDFEASMEPIISTDTVSCDAGLPSLADLDTIWDDVTSGE